MESRFTKISKLSEFGLEFSLEVFRRSAFPGIAKLMAYIADVGLIAIGSKFEVAANGPLVPFTSYNAEP